jgi:hypothetical protein
VAVKYSIKRAKMARILPVFTKEMIDGQVALCKKHIASEIFPSDEGKMFLGEYNRLIRNGIEPIKAFHMMACVFAFCKIAIEFHVDDNPNFPGLIKGIRGLPETDVEPYLYALVANSKKHLAQTN